MLGLSVLRAALIGVAVTAIAQGQTDLITNAPYVAGAVANPMMLPNTSSATYTGFMAGKVQNGSGSQRSAATRSPANDGELSHTRRHQPAALCQRSQSLAPNSSRMT